MTQTPANPQASESTTTAGAQTVQAPQLTAKDLGKHCLVTGGAGYVGSQLVQRLVAAGCKVRSLDVQAHSHEGDVETMVGDLRDYAAVQKACEGIDTVFHTAALISTLQWCRPSVRRFVYDVNVQGSINVARAAEEAGAKAMVHTSTFCVVLDRDGLDDQDESLAYATRSHDLYTTTKIEAERAVLSADREGGLRTAALRPGGVWGPNVNSIMIRNFLQELAKGKFKVLIGNGKANMDNTHVENLLDAQLLAARALRSKDCPAGGQAYFIVDEEQVNPLEWFRPLTEGLGEKFPKFYLPGGLMRFVGGMLELAHMVGGPEPVLTRRAMRNMTESSSFRVDKARRDLGYEPRYKRENGIPELLPAAREYVESLRTQTA